MTDQQLDRRNRTVCGALGLALIVVGVAWIYAPAAVITLGVLLVSAAVWWHDSSRNSSDPWRPGA